MNRVDLDIGIAIGHAIKLGNECMSEACLMSCVSPTAMKKKRLQQPHTEAFNRYVFPGGHALHVRLASVRMDAPVFQAETLREKLLSR